MEGVERNRTMLLKSLNKKAELNSIPLIDIDTSLFIEIWLYISYIKAFAILPTVFKLDSVGTLGFFFIIAFTRYNAHCAD